MNPWTALGERLDAQVEGLERALVRQRTRELLDELHIVLGPRLDSHLHDALQEALLTSSSEDWERASAEGPCGEGVRRLRAFRAARELWASVDADVEGDERLSAFREQLTDELQPSIADLQALLADLEPLERAVKRVAKRPLQGWPLERIGTVRGLHKQWNEHTQEVLGELQTLQPEDLDDGPAFSLEPAAEVVTAMQAQLEEREAWAFVLHEIAPFLDHAAAGDQPE